MKRTLTILFTCIYLLSVSGILYGQHLCMGRVSESALFTQVETKCGMSGDMHQSMEHCCDDEWALEIVDDVQNASQSINAPNTTFHLVAEIILFELQFDILEQKLVGLSNDTGPPDDHPQELYLLYNNLKIPFGLPI